MYSPEKYQVAVCLLKSDLDGIENELVSQRASFPDLDAESESKYRKTMKALESARHLNVEIEKIRQENVRLFAKHTQLKHQKQETVKQTNDAISTSTELKTQVQATEEKMEQLIRRYEDSLRIKAEMFRSTHFYYDEEKMRAEIESEKEKMANLERALVERQRIVDEKKSEIAALACDVPENLLDIVGKYELEQQRTNLETQLEALHKEKEMFTPLAWRK